MPTYDDDECRRRGPGFWRKRLKDVEAILPVEGMLVHASLPGVSVSFFTLQPMTYVWLLDDDAQVHVRKRLDEIHELRSFAGYGDGRSQHVEPSLVTKLPDMSYFWAIQTTVLTQQW